MNDFKLTYSYGGMTKDITAITSNYSRSDQIDQLGEEFTFDLIENPLDVITRETFWSSAERFALKTTELLFSLESSRKNLKKDYQSLNTRHMTTLGF